MSALTDADTAVTLFDKEQQQPHIVVQKLKQFVNLSVDPFDRLPSKVCQSCVVNLDFCIQFVDRCRRVTNLMQIQIGEEGAGDKMQMGTIQSELNSHYPYLYGSNHSVPTNQDRNPQSVPFPHGSFFGPTQTQVVQNSSAKSTEDALSVAQINNTNKRCIRKILPKHLQQDSILSNSSSNCSEKKIAVSAATGGLTTNPTTAVSNLKTHVHNGQYMIPVTLMTPCKTCNAMITASNVQDIQNHTCPKKGKKVLCTVDGCNKKFFTQVTLRYHMKHYHKLCQSSSSKQTSNLVKVKSDDGITINTTTQIIDRYVNKPEEKTAESPSSHKFVCSWPNCSKSYRAKSYLVEHRRTHTGDRPFTCSNCSRGFSRILDVKKHQLLKVCHLNSK